jgi:predicted dehydrogenase
MKGKLSEMKADIDDAYAMLYKFSSGTVGTVMIDVISRDPVRSLHIMGSEGSITWDWNTSTVRLYDPKSKSWSEFKEAEKVAQPGYWAKDDMYIEEMRYFVNCVSGAGKVSYSLDDDLRILKFLVDAETSSDKGVHIKV